MMVFNEQADLNLYKFHRPHILTITSEVFFGISAIAMAAFA